MINLWTFYCLKKSCQMNNIFCHIFNEWRASLTPFASSGRMQRPALDCKLLPHSPSRTIKEESVMSGTKTIHPPCWFLAGDSKSRDWNTGKRDQMCSSNKKKYCAVESHTTVYGGYLQPKDSLCIVMNHGSSLHASGPHTEASQGALHKELLKGHESINCLVLNRHFNST